VYVQIRGFAAAKGGNMGVAVVVVGLQIHEAGYMSTNTSSLRCRATRRHTNRDSKQALSAMLSQNNHYKGLNNVAREPDVYSANAGARRAFDKRVFDLFGRSKYGSFTVEQRKACTIDRNHSLQDRYTINTPLTFMLYMKCVSYLALSCHRSFFTIHDLLVDELVSRNSIILLLFSRLFVEISQVKAKRSRNANSIQSEA